MEWNTGSYEYSPRHRLPGSNTPAGSNAPRGYNLKFPRQLPICFQELSLPTPFSPQNLDCKSVAARQRRPETHAASFDFRRPDRIPKSQVRAIQVLHDTFVTSLASSLSAFRRTYLTVKLLALREGNLLAFSYAVARPLELHVNGAGRFTVRWSVTAGAGHI
jgi:hypothetical protein